MKLEYIFSIVFVLGLIAGVSALVSYFLNEGFMQVFVLCAGLFVLIILTMSLLAHLFAKK